LIKDFHVTGPRFQMRSLHSGLHKRNFRNQREGGYVLLTLLLMASLLVIAAAVVAPMITLQIKRDKEEELIHRGMEYRRAIRAYAKHTGNFPLTLDQLEHATGNRYLRRRYKDPITGKDFRLLHMDDIAKLGASSNPAGTPPGGNANSTTGIFSNASVPSANPPDATTDQNAENAQPASPGSPTPQTNSSSNLFSNPPPGGAGFGGGVIMGVASSSPKKTIREFNHKNHYNQWLFFYSANYDGAVEVKGPTPSTPVFASPQGSSAQGSLPLGQGQGQSSFGSPNPQQPSPPSAQPQQ
jgi:type II secretory pathway pseudopilin PulG